MALLKLGSVVTEARGKLGGQALQMQSGRCVLLSSRKPRVHKALTGAVFVYRHMYYINAWKGLTEAQRIAWNKKAANRSAIQCGSFPHKLSGRNLFVQTNTKYFYGTSVFFPNPPSFAPITALTISSVIVNPSVLGIRVYLSRLVGANEIWTVFASAPTSRGVMHYRGNYRYAGTLSAGASTYLNCIAQYIATFGAVPKVGMKVFFRAYVSNAVTGSFTKYAYLSGICY